MKHELDSLVLHRIPDRKNAQGKGALDSLVLHRIPDRRMRREKGRCNTK
jgi:hypothetical protein